MDETLKQVQGDSSYLCNRFLIAEISDF